MSAKIHGKLLVALAAALAVALAATPMASADFSFEPGSVIAKGHAPVNTTPPATLTNQGQGSFTAAGEFEAWAQGFADAPELTQAGGHPDFTTAFNIDLPSPESLREVIADAPAGALGNALAVPSCSLADFYGSQLGNCPTEAQVGVEAVDAGEGLAFLVPVFNLVPSPGAPALFGFKATAVSSVLTPSVRSDGDYGLRVGIDSIEASYPVDMSVLTLWGVPYDPVHDKHRIDRNTGTWGGHFAGTPVPFLSAPTNCSTGPLSLG